MEKVIQDVIDDMALTEQEVNRVGVFVSNLGEPLTWGDLSNSNILISYPEYLHNIDKRDVDTSIVKSWTQDEALDIPEAQEMISTLVMSEKAKKFLIARELFRSKNQVNRDNGIGAVLLTLITYSVARLSNKTYGLHQRPKIYRYGMYALVAGTMSFLHICLRDRGNRVQEVKIDELASRQGRDYAEGGVEYFDKVCRHRIALRTLMPERAGERYYSLKGNELPSLLRNKTVPTTKRRENCQQILTSEF